MQWGLSAFIVYAYISKLLQSRRVLVCCWTAEGTLKSENTMIIFTRSFGDCYFHLIVYTFPLLNYHVGYLFFDVYHRMLHRLVF